VEIFHLKISQHGKSWLVQLATTTKRRINELVQNYPLDMNGINTNVEINIIPLGSFDYLIGMDWLEKNHVFLDYYNKEFTCLDEEGNLRLVQGIQREMAAK
jgi:hypothetical protein